MKEMTDSSLSVFCGIDWSAPDDATIEGEFPLSPLTLRYTRATRRLHLRLTEISALETWGQPSLGSADAPVQELTARGELTEVLAVFELGGGPVRQFREVRRVTITTSPVGPHSDSAFQQCNDPELPEKAGPQGALFVDFEALRIHGEHPAPVLSLIVLIGETEFRRANALVSKRAEEIRDMTLVLDAELFGDDIGPDEAWGGWTPEYGILRPADMPLAQAPARLDRMDVILGRSLVLGAGAVTHAPTEDASAWGVDQPDDGAAFIARRLGWIIALLTVIALILLFGEGETDRIQRLPRQIAENTQSSMPETAWDDVAV